MTAGLAGQLMALALAASVPASAAGRIAIDHARVDCVPYDRYPRIAATGAPADGVATAQLQFRAGGDGGWYSVGMAAEGTAWSAFLPRPIRPLARLEYRIVMRWSDAGEAATAVNVVRVGGDPAECSGAVLSSAALAAPIVVRVPEGAPVVPPVPAGFSPAGVVAVEEAARKTSGLTKLAVGTALAGGVAAGALFGNGAFGQPPELSLTPGFRFSGIAPVPGSVLSSSSGQLSVFVLVTGRSNLPLDFNWVFELMGVGVESVCLSMSGRLNVAASLPATVTLVGPLFPRVASCGERFDVDRSRLRVIIRGQTVFDEVQAPLPFHFEP